MNKKYQIGNQLTGIPETADTWEDAKALQARIKSDFRAAQYPTPSINYKTTVDNKISYFVTVDNAPPSDLSDPQYNTDWAFEGYEDDKTKPSSYIYHKYNYGPKEFNTYAEALADALASIDYTMDVENADLFVISVLVQDESDGLWFQSRSDENGEPTAHRYQNISLG
jgi:hypothetical protein